MKFIFLVLFFVPSFSYGETYLLIKNNKVVDAIKADPDFIKKIEDRFDSVVEKTVDIKANPGWEFKGGKFIEPEKTQEQKDREKQEKDKETALKAKLKTLSDTFQDCHDNYADYVQNQKAKEHACRALLYKTLPRILKGVAQALED